MKGPVFEPGCCWKGGNLIWTGKKKVLENLQRFINEKKKGGRAKETIRKWAPHTGIGKGRGELGIA